MTDTTPTLSIRYAWRRAVNRDYRLTEADRRVLFELESYADPDGTNAHPGNERIAESLATGPDGEHVSMSSVERGLRQGRQLGYIVQTKKGGRRKINGTVVKVASVWRLALPVSASTASPVMTVTGDRQECPEIADQTASHHPSNESTSPVTAMTGYQSLPTSSLEKMKNTRSAGADREGQPVDKSVGGELSTAEARAWRDGEPTRDEHPIHPEWTPNKTNRRIAADLGLNLDVLAAKFHAGFLASGERRDNWGKAFTRYLKDEAEGRAEVTFTGIDEDAADAVVADHVRETYKALNAPEADAPTSPLSEPEFAQEERQEPVGTAIDTKIDDGGRHWQCETPAEELVAAEPVEAVEQVTIPTIPEDGWRIGVQLRKIKAALPLGFRPGERDQAEAMLANGTTADTVIDAIKQARAAHRAKVDAELAARRPVPMPVLV